MWTKKKQPEMKYNNTHTHTRKKKECPNETKYAEVVESIKLWWN